MTENQTYGKKRSPAVAMDSQPYHQCPKASIRLPVSCREKAIPENCLQFQWTQLSNATINASRTDVTCSYLTRHHIIL